jgi:peptidyl-prolyl cis-trans isomerase C
MKGSRTVLWGIAMMALASCAQKPSGSTAGTKVDNVAVVDGKAISRNTYNHYVQGVAGKPAETLTAEQRAQLLDNLIRGEVIAADAEKSGIAARDETRAVMDLSRLQVLQQASSESYLKDRKPSDEELKNEYDLQVSKMPKTQYRTSHILVPTEEAAKQIITQLDHGSPFDKLAKQSSTDTGSKDNGGDLGWFPRGIMLTEFDDAAFALEVGKVSQPVKSAYGYHIIRVEEKGVRALEEPMASQVHQDAFMEWLNGQRSAAKIERQFVAAPTPAATQAAPTATTPAATPTPKP